MAKTVHYRLPVSGRDGFTPRTACGAKSESLTAEEKDVTCRRCKGSELYKARKERRADLARLKKRSV